MRVATTADGWVLEAIGDLEWMFLERLPGMAAGDDLPPEQKRRLLPDPIAGDSLPDDGEADELRSDWDEFVKPELNLAFADAREQVAKDLTAVTESTGDPFAGGEEAADDDGDDDEEEGTGMLLDPDETCFRLEVPGEHSELWYNTLNQARLLMNEVYDLASSERSMFERMLRRQMAEEEGNEEGEEEAVAPDGMLLMLLAQYQFYSFIQNFLVERIMKP